jgi:uncharacterized protein (TIGR02301 family)
MNGAVTFAEKRKSPGRVLRVLASGLIYIATLPAPARAQFEFLFGGHPESKPPPAQVQPEGRRPAASTGRHHKSKQKTSGGTKPETTSKAAPPGAEEPLPPYDPELLRLAEILGALTYLDELCAAGSKGGWRANMQTLLEAEAKTNARKERLAGSYNRGFRDYQMTYRFCTPNAQEAIDRFLAEGSKIAHEVINRYGAS